MGGPREGIAQLHLGIDEIQKDVSENQKDIYQIAARISASERDEGEKETTDCADDTDGKSGN